MGTKEELSKAQEYDPERHGNVFDFIVTECRRLRYWNTTGKEPAKALPPPTFKELKGFHGRHAVLVHQAYEPSADSPGKYTFEISKARKL